MSTSSVYSWQACVQAEAAVQAVAQQLAKWRSDDGSTPGQAAAGTQWQSDSQVIRCMPDVARRHLTHTCYKVPADPSSLTA